MDPIKATHAFSVDVEEWYQGIPAADSVKSVAERRLDRGLNPLLDLLAEHGIKATFFILGPVVQENPELIRRIANEGHEIGCHGWSHDLVYTMTPERFREETRHARDAVSNLTGRQVTAYRAAYFSITRQSFWALEELVGLGFRYDSSIFPVKNWRYGIPDFEPRPQSVMTGNGPILELPLPVRKVLGKNLPLSGGAYFRLYPYAVTRNNFRFAESRGIPAVFYLHPWELDPDHPRVAFDWRARATHYAQLRSTLPKLERLLKEFQFSSIGSVLNHAITGTC